MKPAVIQGAPTDAKLPAGKVSDIFGRKPMLLLCNAIFFVGSLIAALSINMNMLLAARVIQGIGGGGLVVLVNIAISDLFAMRDRGAYFGVIGGIWALARLVPAKKASRAMKLIFGSATGPIFGGLFTERLSWRLVPRKKSYTYCILIPADGVSGSICHSMAWPSSSYCSASISTRQRRHS